MTKEAELLQRLNDALKADPTIQLVVGPFFITKLAVMVEFRRGCQPARCGCFANLTDGLVWTLNALEKETEKSR